MWIVVKTWLWDCLKSVIDTGNWSGISVENCTRSQNQGIPGQPGAITMMRQLHCLIFGSPYEGESWEGKHKQRDPTSLCLEHLCPKHVNLALEIHTMELCGSDEWQIDLHEE